MALLQISEPGQGGPRRRACGIDLGTTHSLVAVMRDGQAITLPDAEGHHRLPSVVHYGAGSETVGWSAVQAAADDPDNTFFSIKRSMGRGTADLDDAHDLVEEAAVGVPRFRTVAGPKTAVEISADILSALRARAEEELGGELDGAVITVPAYFDEAQRQATKDAARLAGLPVLRLINEPTAASIAYGLDQRDDRGLIAVFDLGGGTFDISILRLSRGVFEVLATGGDTELGGDDLDWILLTWAQKECGVEEADRAWTRRILQVVRQAREALSEQESVRVDCGNGRVLTLTRDELEQWSAPLLERMLQCCRRALSDAGVEAGEVQEVVMVGGVTRMPYLRREVSKFFSREVHTGIDPDRVVALGAAVQADVLVGNAQDQDLLLLDVIPLSLGIEIMGGLVERIIDRNTTIPAHHAQEFTTFKDGQTALAVHVVQGERELVSDCRSLARFELRGIPPMTAGAARIRVEYQVDADGLLTVEAMETVSGVRAGVSVKPSYGLEESEIEQMLRESIEHAEEDVASRALNEQQVEADRVVQALRDALAADGDILSNDAERVGIEAAAQALIQLRDGTDADAIRAGIKALEEACEPFVERRMNRSIRQAMQGHKVEEFQEQD